MNIMELVTPANISAYWDARKANQSLYMGEMLFPAEKVQGLELNKVSGRAGLPVQLVPSAFDTEATYRDRLSISVEKTNMPLFRERMKIDETTRQQIMMISQDSILKAYIPRIFDDTNNLIRGARAARERMAMELISTGKISVKGNGVNMEYDYHLNKDQKVKPSTKWTDAANATPIQDMIDWIDDFRTKYGVVMEYAVMNTKTFNLIKATDEIRKVLYPTATSTSMQLVTPQQIKDTIERFVGVRILLNDNTYALKVGGKGVKFFPDGVVTFLPRGGVVGKMTFGTTPEEVDLQTNPKFASNTSIVDLGVAVYTRTIDHPVNVEVIVSQICLPSFGADIEGGAGDILIANVD